MSFNIAPLCDIVLRTMVVYVLVLIGVKLLGKKEMGQMGAPDLVLVLLLANAVQNAMVGPDTSLVGGLLAAAVLLAMNRILNTLTSRNERLEHIVDGVPTLLVHDGKMIMSHCRHEQVTQAHIETAMREHGIENLDSVKAAVLEPDGSISIVPMGATTLTSKHKVKRIRRRPNH